MEEIETCEIIYEKYRHNKLNGKIRTKLICFISIIISLNAIITITLYQYNAYISFIRIQRNNLIENSIICNKQLQSINIDLLSTFFSLFLLISYALVYKRRNFLRNKLKCKHFGLPMIVSCWNKVNFSVW